MKIITKSVMRWVDDQLVVVEEESYEHTGPVAEAKGGGSSQRDLTPQELDILEAQLRGMNRAQAFEEQYAYPMKERLASDVEGWGSLINADTAADRAGADVGKSFDRMQGKQDYDLASMGINPSDVRYIDAKNRMSIEGLGMQAAAMSGARENRLKEGISMRQAYLTNSPINPNYANNAATMAGQQGDATRRGAMADANGWYNATMGAGQLASVASNAGWFGADGGPVHLEDGGFVHKGIIHARNGALIQDYSRMPMPDRGGKTPNAPTTGDYAMGLGKSAIASKPVMSAAKPYVDEAMVKMGFKEAAPEASQSLFDATQQQVGGAMEDYTYNLAQDSANFMPDLATAGAEGVAEGAAAEGATAAAGEAAAAEAAAIAAAEAAAAEAAAAGTATALAGAEAGAAAGSVVPGIGTAIGALAGAGLGALFAKDGGKMKKQGIRPGTVGKTGKVQGPGGPKDDLIPAMLSDGEYVMPVGAVRFYGLDKLEKMRQKGLEYEKQLGIRRA